MLEKLLPVVPGLIGGSADLTGSNGTLTKLHSIVKPGDFAGNYIHYGVREHGMAAAMNGMALHGGIVPYGGTFLVFTDYCRPSIRLSALMRQRVIYVMTHDSIGLGEDGPTHQPVEHLAALRAIPNLNVMRPADSVECAECWEIALLAKSTPTILSLTRQGLPPLRTAATPENLSARGAYVLIEPRGAARRDADRYRLRAGPGGRSGQGPRRRGDPRRGGVDALLRAVRGAERRLSGRGAGHRAPRRGRGRRRFGWENGSGLTAPSSACTDSVLRRRLKPYISISASPPRPSPPRPVTVDRQDQEVRERMSNKRVAINGFGRIGRLTFRAYLESGRKDLDFVAINDLGSAEMNAHLLEFDSVHGRFRGKIDVADGHLKTNGQDVAVLSEATPEKLPWRDLDVDIVMECTGRFTDRDGAAKHLTAGAKRVLVSAPCTAPT